MSRVRVLLAGALLLAGCVKVNPADGAFTCGAGGACPDGYHCAADNRCWNNGHEPDLFNYFLYQLNEEQYHPDLAKKFGLAIGLTEEEFQKAVPVFECLAHTSKTIHGMLLGSASENRASALVNETMVCRYSEEFNNSLRQHYGLDNKALQFFTVHSVADQEHTKMAADVIMRHAQTDHQLELVRDSARHMVRFKIAKFDGIYDAYA